MMKRNMGNIDRVIRSIVAVVLLILFYNGTIQGTFGVILLLVAGIFVLTSFVSFCPLYALFRISSCKISAADQAK